MLKRLLSICLLCGCCIAGWAQELNCKVTIRHDKITGVDPAVFTAMQRAITEFLNSHKWTTDEFAVVEKIDCNILINLTGNNVNADVDGYSATLNIQATRPVYNSTYTSNLINYIDKDIAFHFSQFNTLQFDDNQVSGNDAMSSNLTAVLAFYSYLILGLTTTVFHLMAAPPC